MTSRRTFLKASAATAGLAAFPALLTTAQARLSAVPELLANDTYPIGFFWPPPPDQTTVARYKQIADAGFTFVNSGNDVYNWDRSLQMMRACEANGLAALPSDDRIGGATVCPGWLDSVKRVRDEYAAASPAYAGFRLADEPSPVHYPRFRMIADAVAEAGPTDLTHINLVPLYDTVRIAMYRDFLARYVDQFAPTFISYDHYPLLTDPNTKVRPSYFLNWALVREAGLRANVPTWMYIQAVDHWNLKSPTRQELQWQISMSLAYGCKGIQYFTYWTPIGRPDFEFGTALIGKNLQPSRLYYDAQDINVHWLRPYGRELKHLVSESVMHINESPMPVGTVGFTASPQLLSVSGDPVVLGQFRAAADDGRRWLFVANRSYAVNDNATTTLTVQPGVGLVEEFTPVSGGEFGQYTPVTLSAARSFSSTIQPGSGRLYRLTPA
jgi:hypothetical protein